MMDQPERIPLLHDVNNGGHERYSSPVSTAPTALKAARCALPLMLSFAVFLVALSQEAALAAWLAPPVGEVSLQARLAAARCLAVFALVVALWATHALPLHVTALLVAPLCVGLRVFVDGTGEPLQPAAAADRVLHAMGNDAVFMVLGVYALGAALQKTALEKLLSRALLSVAASPLRLLAVVMLMAVTVSTFVSNVFAPVMLLSVLTPLFHALGDESRPLVKSVILGVSVASNIGGMPSPVSSPQNIVARALMRDAGGVSFATWLTATVPQCAAMLVIAYVFIVLRFQTHRYQFRPILFPEAPKVELGVVDLVVMATFSITVFLWIAPIGNQLFGHAGVVSMIPVVILLGSQTLTLVDFKQLPWNVIYLVAGGTAMGDAVNSSHLLNLLAFKLSDVLRKSSVWLAFCGSVIFMAIVSEGISHTVSAIIVLPLVQKIGITLGHPRLMVMGGVLACSGAMSLPVSSFPNMSAFGVVDTRGDSYLKPHDMLISGLPMSIACSAVVCTLGYLLMAGVLGM